MRIQLELPDSRVDRLKLLMKTAGVDTYKDLVNNAITLLDWALFEVQAGREIASLDEGKGKYRQLTMPIFDYARREAEVKPEPELVGGR